MARIDIERKKTPVWPWLVAVIIVALIIWALFAMGDEKDDTLVAPAVVTAPLETPPLPIANESMQEATQTVTAAPMPPPPTEADDTVIPVATIIIGPVHFLGQPVVGTGRVAAVVSDRGFWLEQDAQRIFVMIARSPSMEQAVDVNPGQRVRLAGVVYNQSMTSQIAGGIEQDAMKLVADQPAFLLVNAMNVVVLDK